MNDKDSIDKQVRDQSMNVVFQEEEWSIVHEVGVPVPPWISHYCEGWETDKGTKSLTAARRWNYSFSTPYALKYFDRDVLYCCCKCRKKAPDSIITIFELLR